MLNMVLSVAVIVIFFMTFFFFIAQVVEDSSIVDIAWGLGVIVIALYTLIAYGDWQYRQVLITVITVIWGLRLAGHILIRKMGKGEDFRYRKMRKKWGKHFLFKSYFFIFVLQGVLMIVISLPIMIINYYHSDTATLLDEIGLTIWSFGLVYEVMSDWELGIFKKNPKNKGKIMKTGLWSYCRHPNYFGEAALWWGVFLIALSSPNGAYALISPLLITNLLMYFSGIPLLEKKYKNNDEYQKYARNTPVFVPRISKK